MLPAVTYSDRYLNREERYELARLRESGLSMRQIAGRLAGAQLVDGQPGAGPQRRPAGARVPARARPPAGLGAAAQAQAVEAVEDTRYYARRCSRCWTGGTSRADRLAGRWRSPDDPAMRVSHETIYQLIYLYPAASCAGS